MPLALNRIGFTRIPRYATFDVHKCCFSRLSILFLFKMFNSPRSLTLVCVSFDSFGFQTDKRKHMTNFNFCLSLQVYCSNLSILQVYSLQRIRILLIMCILDEHFLRVVVSSMWPPPLRVDCGSVLRIECTIKQNINTVCLILSASLVGHLVRHHEMFGMYWLTAVLDSVTKTM